jgi:hypothetical protein
VAVCEQAHEHAVDQVLLADDGFGDLGSDGLDHHALALDALVDRLDLVRLDRHLVLRSEFRVREPVVRSRAEKTRETARRVAARGGRAHDVHGNA